MIAWFDRVVWPYLWWLGRVIMFFVPHFETEDVAVDMRPDGDYEVMCSMSAVCDGERHDGVVSLTSFCWMFWGFPAGIGTKQGMDVRPWPEGGAK